MANSSMDFAIVGGCITIINFFGTRQKSVIEQVKKDTEMAVKLDTMSSDISGIRSDVKSLTCLHNKVNEHDIRIAEAIKTGKVILGTQYPSGKVHEFTWNEEAEILEATFVTEGTVITEQSAGNLYVYVVRQ